MRPATFVARRQHLRAVHHVESRRPRAGARCKLADQRHAATACRVPLQFQNDTFPNDPAATTSSNATQQKFEPRRSWPQDAGDLVQVHGARCGQRGIVTSSPWTTAREDRTGYQTKVRGATPRAITRILSRCRPSISPRRHPSSVPGRGSSPPHTPLGCDYTAALGLYLAPASAVASERAFMIPHGRITAGTQT